MLPRALPVVLLALLALACEDRHTTRSVQIDAAVDAAVAEPDASDDAPGPEILVRFVLEPRDGGARELVVLADAIGLRREVGTVAPGRRCELVVGPVFDEMTDYEQGEQIVVGCALDHGSMEVVTTRHYLSISPPAAARRRGGGRDRVPLPTGTQIIGAHELVDPADAQEVCDGGTASSIEIRADDVRSEEARDVRLRAPAIGFEMELGHLNEYCRGRASAAGHFDLHCQAADGGESLVLEERAGVLFATWVVTNLGQYDAHPLGGYVLPCGAHVHFPRVRVVDPRWEPLGGCAACVVASDDCDDACSAAHVDSGTCEERCEGSWEACEQRCLQEAQRKSEQMLK